MIQQKKDGKAVVAGSSLLSGIGNNNNFALARFNNDGSLDKTFDNDGKITTAFGNDAYCGSVQIQTDGKIIAAGEIHDRDYSTNMAVTRYNSNGKPDSTFGADGKLITDLGGNEAVADAALYNNTLYITGNDIVAAFDISDKNIPPVVRLTAPADNATYLAPAAHIKLSATASDADDTITKVEFYNGNKLLHTETLAPYGYAWRNVPSGNYSITAKAYDNSGNVTTSAAIHISVVPNKPPIVSIIKPANNQNFTAPADIRLGASASDTDGRITKVEFYKNSILLRTEYKYRHTTSAPITVTVFSDSSITSNRSYSKTEKTALNDALSLKLSPNPATNILNIYAPGLNQNKQASLSIISVSGIVLKTIRISNPTTQLDVKLLVSGVYTIKVTSGEKVLYKQFVKL